MGWHLQWWWWCSFILSGIVAFHYVLVDRCRNSRRVSAFAPELPPSPPYSLPIVGHLHLLGELPHQSLHSLARIHGPLMSLRLGSVRAIVASTADSARDILQTHDSNFVSRARTAAAVYCCFDCSDIALAPSGPSWRLLRRLCATELLSKKRLEGFRPMRAEEMALLVRSVYADNKMDREEQVFSRLAHTANNIISRMAVGKTILELCNDGNPQDPSTTIVDLIIKVHHLLGVFNVGDFIPSLQWMDLQGYVKRMKSVGKGWNVLLQKLIDSRRGSERAVDQSSPKDLLDVLLSIRQDNQQLDVPITDANIKGFLMDMFAGGTDTSAATVEWALAELLRKPAILKKLQNELDCVVGRECLVVQESDIPKLPYLQAVVKETMRLHPVGPLMVPHVAIQSCTVAGYHVPAGTRAFVNLWAIGRDPNAWERATEFWPERFVGSDVDVMGKHFQLLPFGAGKRACPGRALGLSTVQLMLGSLVHGFEWELPLIQQPAAAQNIHMELDMSEKFGLIMGKAIRLVATATPRLPAHLYVESSLPA